MKWITAEGDVRLKGKTLGGDPVRGPIYVCPLCGSIAVVLELHEEYHQKRGEQE